MARTRRVHRRVIRNRLERRKDFFLPQEDEHAYSEGMRRGGVLLTVWARKGEEERALQILEASRAVDFEERQQQWRQEGWQGPPPAAESVIRLENRGERPSFDRRGAPVIPQLGSGSYLSGSFAAWPAQVDPSSRSLSVNNALSCGQRRCSWRTA